MNLKLEEINDLYLQVQNLIDPTVEYLAALTDEERFELESNRDEYSLLYKIAREKYIEIAFQLSPAEVIEGYQQGCRLLQRNLSGLMCHRFDSVYIPVMIEAIKKDEPHTAFFFLQSLADHLGTEIASIVTEALDSKYAHTRETALAVAYQLKLVEVAPKVEEMVDDSHPNVSYLAKQILGSWEGNT
jgi:hypothetical protein